MDYYWLPIFFVWSVYQNFYAIFWTLLNTEKVLNWYSENFYYLSLIWIYKLLVRSLKVTFILLKFTFSLIFLINLVMSWKLFLRFMFLLKGWWKLRSEFNHLEPFFLINDLSIWSIKNFLPETIVERIAVNLSDTIFLT